jgi:hypothetical protein
MGVGDRFGAVYLPQRVTECRYSIWTVLPRYDSGGRWGEGRARIFAAAEAYYMDRRLAGNVVLSFFDGPKAGSDEVVTFHPMPLTTLPRNRSDWPT